MSSQKYPVYIPTIPGRLVVVSTPPRPLNGVVVVAVVVTATDVVAAVNGLNKLPPPGKTFIHVCQC